MKAIPTQERPWGYPHDKSLYVNDCEIVIPAGEYPTCEALCAAINERCGKAVTYPQEPSEGMWILGFDEKLMQELREERLEILFRRFDRATEAQR